VFPFHAEDVCLQVLSDAPMFHCLWQFIAGKPLLLTVSLRESHAHLHVCPFVLICQLLWHPPCTNYVITWAPCGWWIMHIHSWYPT